MPRKKDQKPGKGPKPTNPLDDLKEARANGVRGIVNLGNTCFFNSVMQNLMMTEPFYDKLLALSPPDLQEPEEDETERQELDEDVDDIGEIGPFVSLMIDFFEEMSSKDFAGNVRPSVLFTELSRQAPRYKGFHQHDAHELLDTVLDIISIEERKRQRELEASRIVRQGEEEKKAEEEEESRERKRVPSTTLVDEVFRGKCRQGIMCLRCGKESVTYQPQTHISLGIPTRFVTAPKSETGDAVDENPLEHLSKREQKQALKKQLKLKQTEKMGSGRKDSTKTDKWLQSGDKSVEEIPAGKISKKDLKKQEREKRKEEMRAAKNRRRRRLSSDDSGDEGEDDEADKRDELSLREGANQDENESNEKEEEAVECEDIAARDGGEDSCHVMNNPTVKVAVSKAFQNEVEGPLKFADYDEERTVPERQNGQSGGIADPEIESSIGDSLEDSASNSIGSNPKTGHLKTDDLKGTDSPHESTGQHSCDDAGPSDESISDRYRAQEDECELQQHTRDESRRVSFAEVDSLEEVIDLAPDKQEDTEEDKHSADYDQDKELEKFLEQQDRVAVEKRQRKTTDRHDETAEGNKSEGDDDENELDRFLAEQDRVAVEKRQQTNSGNADSTDVEYLQKALGSWSMGVSSISEATEPSNGACAQAPNDSKLTDGPTTPTKASEFQRSQRTAPLGAAFNVENADQSKGIRSIPPSEDCTLLECLKDHVCVEVLDGNNMYACEGCSQDLKSKGQSRSIRRSPKQENSDGSSDSDEQEEIEVKVTVKSPATKQNLLWETPPILVMHLKRFETTERRKLRKIDKFVSFPLSLDLSNFFHRDAAIEQIMYELYGVVEHHGSLHSGHYVAYVKEDRSASKDGTDATWYYLSDTSVKKVPEEKVLGTQAYLLFYRKLSSA